ncbi:MAG TPA: MerR family transcriptional regulator [Acidimicrobiales bacterium]|jgi:DNA-binding transcriptional MerR regulator|nr:MerR family transcriptional regulator [Acidimicrobiales bacterium]
MGTHRRIGEVAELADVTTRTLRYWQEIGLLQLDERGESSERIYSEADVERVMRIRELQVLLGFSLAEIRVILDTDNLVDTFRTARQKDARPEVQRQLLAQAMEANDGLLHRLDDTIVRISNFRDERATKALRMIDRAAVLDEEIAALDSTRSQVP